MDEQYAKLWEELDFNRKKYWNERDSAWAKHNTTVVGTTAAKDVGNALTGAGVLGSLFLKSVSPWSALFVGSCAVTTAFFTFLSEEDHEAKSIQCNQVANQYDALRREVQFTAWRLHKYDNEEIRKKFQNFNKQMSQINGPVVSSEAEEMAKKSIALSHTEYRTGKIMSNRPDKEIIQKEMANLIEDAECSEELYEFNTNTLKWNDKFITGTARVSAIFFNLATAGSVYAQFTNVLTPMTKLYCLPIFGVCAIVANAISHRRYDSDAERSDATRREYKSFIFKANSFDQSQDFNVTSNIVRELQTELVQINTRSPPLYYEDTWERAQKKKRPSS